MHRTGRVRIAKCNLFFHYRDAKENLILLFSQYKTLCKTWKNTLEYHLYCWCLVCKVNWWCLIDCFHRQFRISTQIMVFDHCKGLLMTFWANFLWFKIFTLISISRMFVFIKYSKSELVTFCVAESVFSVLKKFVFDFFDRKICK